MKIFNQLACAWAAMAVAGAHADAQTNGVVDYGAQPYASKSDTAAISSDLAPYLAQLEKKVGAKGPAKFIGQVTITCTIDKKGAVSDVKVKQSSQMPQIDTKAMTAVKSSAPFPALPSACGKTIGVEVTFAGTSQASTCHAIRTQ